ncbi:hypothetical protein LSH36_390g01055 [Paralvinella palmiformis]|uniref:Uncharacterized protein n=1 Tax=Paralvinella palmiformis TaxID=53620 RepID=A0AAD9JD60_9ANNE|nr:hypothetical protein LSH36_390g01055 [Paralvinella palmiformis]
MNREGDANMSPTSGVSVPNLTLSAAACQNGRAMSPGISPSPPSPAVLDTQPQKPLLSSKASAFSIAALMATSSDSQRDNMSDGCRSPGSAHPGHASSPGSENGLVSPVIVKPGQHGLETVISPLGKGSILNQ